jgi:hypothetical protein
MRKLVLPVTLFALAAPAAAQPAPPPTPLAVKLTVKAGNDTRTYDLSIFDQGCGRVEDKAGAYEDEFHVCSRPAAQGFLVEVQWRTRNGPTEVKMSSASVLKKGTKAELGRVAGTRFTLQLG